MSHEKLFTVGKILKYFLLGTIKKGTSIAFPFHFLLGKTQKFETLNLRVLFYLIMVICCSFSSLRQWGQF